ncbi:MAG: hypothetical protein FWG45_01175 [Oscillospiraceae bacterium]|nr:hypothetical protein [Oscillospiraceae bacterium]
MKKILAFLLAAVMLLAFVSCDSCDSCKQKKPDEVSAEVAKSRTYKALEILDGDTYTSKPNIDGMLSVEIYRRGNDFSFVFLDIRADMIVDGTYYKLEHGNKEAVYRDATEYDYLEMEGNLDGWGEFIDFYGADFTKSGKMDFWGEKDVDYEEFKLWDGTVRRAFFNDNGDIIGFYTIVGEQLSDMPWFISADVPDYMFEIPEGYVKVPQKN